MTTHELDALADLLTSDGWQLLKEHAEAEWGPVGFAQKLSQTLGDPNMDPKLALAQLQQATVSQREVYRLLKWPEERVKSLREKALTPVSMSRRGAGL